MEKIEIMKAVAGLISALGTIAVYKYNFSQSEKAHAELIEKFEHALSQEKKHATCELFRMLHGLRMDYEDIQAICRSSKVSKIIFALKKTGGMVKYEDGRVQYTEFFEKRWVRIFDKYIMRTLTYGMGGIIALSIILMVFLEGPASLAMLVFVIPCAAFLAMQVKDIRHDMMVESLIDESETQQVNKPDSK